MLFGLIVFSVLIMLFSKDLLAVIEYLSILFREIDEAEMKSMVEILDMSRSISMQICNDFLFKIFFIISGSI